MYCFLNNAYLDVCKNGEEGLKRKPNPTDLRFHSESSCMIYRIPIESKYSFVWKCIVEQCPNAKRGLHFQARSKALWNWEESLFWLAGFGVGSYFCGVNGHVSYLIGFRTAGPFVFLVAGNGWKKFNFPCEVPEIGCFNEEHRNPCSCCWAGPLP